MTDDNDVLVVIGKKGRYVLADLQLIVMASRDIC